MKICISPERVRGSTYRRYYYFAMTSSDEIFFDYLHGASICGTNRILFYSLGKLVHQSSATTLDSELVFVNSIWKNVDVEMAISVIFVMIKDSRKSRYLDVLMLLIKSYVRCQIVKKFLHFDTFWRFFVCHSLFLRCRKRANLHLYDRPRKFEL